MGRNHVAQHMNTFNKNSVHKDLRRASLLDDDYSIEEGLEDYNNQQVEVNMTPKWLQNLKDNAVQPVSGDKTIPQELLDKYRQDCINLLPPNSVIVVEQKPGEETHPIHLIWMLQQIASDQTMSQTKRHRWLGYIQGILVSKGAFTVEEEREYTRPMFNGA